MTVIENKVVDYELIEDITAEDECYTYSFDHLGGSFKSYFIANNMPERVRRLKEGLDALSCKYVDYCIESALQFPDLSFRHLFGKNLDIKTSYYPDWLIDDVTANVEKNKPVAGYGLVCLPERAIAYIANKAFFDLGAYDGWSVVVLEGYKPAKTYSFDISPKNHELYNVTSARFTLPYEHHLIALGENCGVLHFDDIGTSGTNIHAPPVDPISVKMMPLDGFVEANLRDEPIGFIKMDIEGAELSAIKGAQQSIKRYRPILSISIYHNPMDFFQIKPLLESWGINYKFMIRKLSLEYTYTPFIDTVLIGYPAELDG